MVDEDGVEELAQITDLDATTFYISAYVEHCTDISDPQLISFVVATSSYALAKYCTNIFNISL